MASTTPIYDRALAIWKIRQDALTAHRISHACHWLLQGRRPCAARDLLERRERLAARLANFGFRLDRATSPRLPK